MVSLGKIIPFHTIKTGFNNSSDYAQVFDQQDLIVQVSAGFISTGLYYSTMDAQEFYEFVCCSINSIYES